MVDLRITDLEADDLALFVEWAIPEAHEMSCSKDGALASDGSRLLDTARRLLTRLAPDAAILDAPLTAGKPFDWDAFYADLDGEDESAVLQDREPAPLQGDA